jgi:hypothetical protein
MTTYKIIRIRMHHSNRVMQRGLTLEQAQAHCKNSETSSSTCTSSKACRYTETYGPWFDGYEVES